jgi:hypothetical protein
MVLQRGQGHLLHLQRLDGGAQGLGILVEPEVHRLQFIDALFEVFDVEGGRDPVAQIGQLGNALAKPLGHPVSGLASQTLQELEAWHELAETAARCLAHGDLLVTLA